MNEQSSTNPAGRGPDTGSTPGECAASNSEWSVPRPLGSRQLAARAIPALVLCGLIAWSWGKAREYAPRELPLPVASGFVDNVPPAPESQPEVEQPDEDESHGELSGVKVSGFLNTRVETWVGDGTELKPVGVSVPPWKSVTLVNLWATWCEPCKRELPGLRALFADGERTEGWGPETRFIALLVDDGVTARAAHDEYIERMPTRTIFLVDRDLDGGVKQRLADAELGASERAERGPAETRLLSASASLPVTLLLDCRRRVRWHHAGVLEHEDFTEIAARIVELRAELGTDRCRPPDRRAPVSEDPPFLPVYTTPEATPDGPDGPSVAPAQSAVDATDGDDPANARAQVGRPADATPRRIALGPKCDRRPGVAGDGHCNCPTEDCFVEPRDCGCVPRLAVCRRQRKGPARCVESELADTRSEVRGEQEEP